MDKKGYVLTWLVYGIRVRMIYDSRVRVQMNEFRWQSFGRNK
jgi:hypothetical protein